MFTRPGTLRNSPYPNKPGGVVAIVIPISNLKTAPQSWDLKKRIPILTRRTSEKHGLLCCDLTLMLEAQTRLIGFKYVSGNISTMF